MTAPCALNITEVLLPSTTIMQGHRVFNMVCLGDPGPIVETGRRRVSMHRNITDSYALLISR